jgi:integrase
LAAAYIAAAAATEPFGVLIRVLILTGQRRGEVAGMRWDELDLHSGLWDIPGERTKNHQAHSVPLPSAAVELIRSVKRRREAEFVFEGVRQTAVSGFGKVKSRLDAALTAAAARAKRPAPTPWTLHDIRRSVATGLQRLGVRLEVTEAVLNHVSGSRSGIVGVYQRHAWAAEKRTALETWARHVLAAVVAESRNETNV